MKNQIYKYLIFAILLLVAESFAEDLPKHNDRGLLTSSIVDDCCCSVDSLVHANHEEIFPQLDALVKKRFFQYFKLDLYSECPFWVSDAVCGIGGCAICECDEDELPRMWRHTITDPVEINTPKNFVSWSDTSENMWIVQGREEDMHYVNLVKYPEGNTGYGKDGSIVWSRIYNENCFKGSIDSMCLEERVFFRLISGLHTSITSHVAKNWELDPETKEWKPNVSYFANKIWPFQDRIRNLYFSYLFMLRALNKAGPYLRDYDYNTGNPSESKEIQDLMKDLLNVDLLCQPNFDESILFSDPEKEDLRMQLKSHFRNISLIMKCVSCEKCKVWATLQTLGVGTALKILLEPDTKTVLQELQRNEIIALINTLRQMSKSIENVEYLRNLMEKQSVSLDLPESVETARESAINNLFS